MFNILIYSANKIYRIKYAFMNIKSTDEFENTYFSDAIKITLIPLQLLQTEFIARYIYLVIVYSVFFFCFVLKLLLGHLNFDLIFFFFSKCFQMETPITSIYFFLK